MIALQFIINLSKFKLLFIFSEKKSDILKNDLLANINLL